MYSTGIKKNVNDELYQNKVKEDFPIVQISADRVSELKDKKYNALFPMKTEVRVIGITEKDIGGDRRETFYTLEIREAGLMEKPTENMNSEEVKEQIEQTVEESDF